MADAAPDVTNENGRERLLRAGLDLFGRKGFAGTSISDLCAHAGVSRGLIRFYFGSKQQLADAVEDMAFAEMDRMIAERSEGSRREGLEASIRASGPTYGSPALTAYLRRALMEPTPRNLRFFQRLFALQRDFVKPLAKDLAVDVDLDWLTMFKIFLEYGPLILGPQVETIFGGPIEASGSRFVDTYWKLVSSVVGDDHLTRVASEIRLGLAGEAGHAQD